MPYGDDSKKSATRRPTPQARRNQDPEKRLYGFETGLKLRELQDEGVEDRGKLQREKERETPALEREGKQKLTPASCVLCLRSYLTDVGKEKHVEAQASAVLCSPHFDVLHEGQ